MKKKSHSSHDNAKKESEEVVFCMVIIRSTTEDDSRVLTSIFGAPKNIVIGISKLARYYGINSTHGYQ